MGNVLAYVDAEGAVKAWVRATVSAFGSRVFLGLPEGGAAYPCATVNRIGGAPQPGDTPIDDAAISLSVWGSSRGMAESATRDLIGAIASINGGTTMTTGVICGGARVNLVLWQPDPDDDTPRYIVDGTFSLRPA